MLGEKRRAALCGLHYSQELSKVEEERVKETEMERGGCMKEREKRTGERKEKNKETKGEKDKEGL